MSNGKPGVMIYFETGRAIKTLDYETKGRLFEAILEYAEYGVVPEFDGTLAVVWPFVSDKIDRDSARYEEIKQKRVAAGKKGGETRSANMKQMLANETNASSDKQIKPSVTTSPTESATGTVTATATISESPIKGIRDNEEMEKGLTLTSQPVDSDSDDRNLSFADRKRQAMEMLSGRM